MSLTDNEIVRAFVCCHIEKQNCIDCPAIANDTDCVNIEKLFVDMFNRLQADKDALIAGQETLQKALAEKDNEIKRLQERNVILRGAVDTQKNDNKRLAGYLADSISHKPRSEAEIKTEARKELAQKLKEQFNDLEFNVKTPRKTLKVEELQDQVNWILREVVIQTIDSVLDETAGGSDA